MLLIAFVSNPILAFLTFSTLSYALLRLPMTSNSLPATLFMHFYNWIPFTTPSYDFKPFTSNLLHACSYVTTLSNSLLRIPTPFYAFNRFLLIENLPFYPFLSLPMLFYAFL